MIPELLIKTSVDDLTANKGKTVLRDNLNPGKVFDFREIYFDTFDGFVDVNIDTRGCVQSFYANYISSVNFREIALSKYNIRCRPFADVSDVRSYVRYIYRDKNMLDEGRVDIISSKYPTVLKPKVYRLISNVGIISVPNDGERVPVLSIGPPTRDYYIALTYFKYNVSDKAVFMHVDRDTDYDYLKVNTFAVSGADIFIPANNSIAVCFINSSSTAYDIKYQLDIAIIRKTAIERYLLGEQTSKDMEYLRSSGILEGLKTGLYKYDVERLELW